MRQAAIQSGLIRLGKAIGNLDGNIGKRSRQALNKLGIPVGMANIPEMLLHVEDMVQQAFPDEFKMPSV
ncbi:hypothetical protein [Spirosoma linguale]|uniref:Uncharacterized protein n=1 Tax=Spirosoma linguale (strain ATCC 33905 / DSM 74 / LMG 10896 / Claus 1) TaxID=504472 RepID=D2QG49_SPILD|nr:hypothetical protein Slin_0592 [Spirosoma linguale DSM 74]